MHDWSLRTPVAFLIFKRPDTTARVFEAIRQARPPTLLIVADGPRPDRPGEAGQCVATRAIVERIDWDCEVLRNYADTNMGCRERVASGLDWVFANVEEAIILEDDCLPHPTFFRFCEELLDRYRDDQRIMHISGDNFQLGRTRTADSYYFSLYSHIWGWATWRRAWQHYDVTIKSWPFIRSNRLLNTIWKHDISSVYWDNIFQRVYSGEIDTWDYQWTLACWINGGLSILPNINLVSNIGFGDNSQHTTNKNDIFAHSSTHSIKFPLSHPSNVDAHREADLFTFYRHFRPRLRYIIAGAVVSLLNNNLKRKRVRG